MINEDIYAGYNDYSPLYSTKDFYQDEVIQEALKTSHSKRSIVSSNIIIIIVFYTYGFTIKSLRVI